MKNLLRKKQESATTLHHNHKCVIYILLVMSSLLLGLNYKVKDSKLEDAVALAFATWQEVDEANFSINVTKDASNIIEYGSGNRFGPDTVSLSIAKSTPQDRTVHAYIHPDRPNDEARAVLHETGILLGLRSIPIKKDLQNEPINPASVLLPYITPQSTAKLTNSDTNAIIDLGLFPAEDLNQDGSVNFYDLAILGREYEQEGVGLIADINDDGKVDSKDADLLRASYVFSAPAEVDPKEQTENNNEPSNEFDTEFSDLNLNELTKDTSVSTIDNIDVVNIANLPDTELINNIIGEQFDFGGSSPTQTITKILAQRYNNTSPLFLNPTSNETSKTTLDYALFLRLLNDLQRGNKP